MIPCCVRCPWMQTLRWRLVELAPRRTRLASSCVSAAIQDCAWQRERSTPALQDRCAMVATTNSISRERESCRLSWRSPSQPIPHQNEYGALSLIQGTRTSNSCSCEASSRRVALVCKATSERRRKMRERCCTFTSTNSTVYPGMNQYKRQRLPSSPHQPRSVVPTSSSSRRPRFLPQTPRGAGEATRAIHSTC